MFWFEEGEKIVTFGQNIYPCKRVRNDVLEFNCKKKHEMSDDQINAMNNYSCKYCKKHFIRSINCRYHALH